MPNEPRPETQKPSHVCRDQILWLDKNVEHPGDYKRLSDYINEIEMVMENTVPKVTAQGAEGGGQLRIEADVGGPDRWDLLGRQWLTVAISTTTLQALPLDDIHYKLGRLITPDIETRCRFVLIFNIWGFKGRKISILCNICLKVPWDSLPMEDGPGCYPHHRSRDALETSAKNCPGCKIILHAAIANWRDSRDIRNGKGCWRRFQSITYVTEGSSGKDVMYIKEYGSCMPATFGKGKGGVFAPTGNFDEDGEHVWREPMPALEALEPESPTASMPVWLYGNWWRDRNEPLGKGKHSDLRLMGIGARFGKSPNILDAISDKPNDMHIRGSAIGVCTSDDSELSRIRGRIPEMQSDSEIAFRRLLNWIDDCESNHSWCKHPTLTNAPLPTRVLDVSASERSVALLESKGQQGRFVALSHSWGTSSKVMATADTIEDLKSGIAISYLPKTFRDAINITKKLGVKYLWIDCLCIVQDDPLDWEKEAVTMGEVYRNAYLTISASTSTDSNTGCLPLRNSSSYVSPATISLGYQTSRDPTGPESFVLEFANTSGPPKTSPMYMFEEWLPGSGSCDPQLSHIGAFGKRFDPLAEEPLSTRGWTLQERLLSRRIIHYAKNQMYFECESYLRSEDGFVFPDVCFSLKHLISTQLIPFEQHGLSQTQGISFIVGKSPSLNSAPGIRWGGGWLMLIENYSKRKLTQPQDKLSALSGLARTIARETNDKYYAGLWARHLLEDLHWRVYAQEERMERGVRRDRPVKGKVLGEIRKVDDYRAPTWSWAYLDAPIRFVPLSYGHLVARAMRCVTTPQGSDAFGSVKAGKLDITGPIFPIVHHEPKKAWDQHGIPVAINFNDERGKSIGALYLDFPDEPLQFPCYALFLDPANALIIRAKDFRPSRDNSGKEDLDKLVPKLIVTSDDVYRNIKKHPTLKIDTIQALNQAVRLGVAVFTKRYGKDGEESEDKDEEEIQEYKPKGKLKLEDVLHVRGGDSWGPVTEKDPKVWVTIV